MIGNWYKLTMVTEFFRLCCAYGNTGNDIRGFDCLIIPAAKSVSGAAIPAARFCGGSKGLVSKGSFTADTNKAFAGARINKTICCMYEQQNLVILFLFEYLVQVYLKSLV